MEFLELTQDKINCTLDSYLMNNNIINNKDEKEFILVPINFSNLRNEVKRIINRNLTENELKYITKYVRNYCILQAKQERTSSLKYFYNNNVINDNNIKISLIMAYSDDYTIGNLCKEVNQKYCIKHNYDFIIDIHPYKELMRLIKPRKHPTWYNCIIFLSNISI